MTTTRVSFSDLEKWIEKLMQTKDIKDYKINVGGNSVKGDGYLGEVTFVSVSTDKNNKEYNFVIKSAKQSEELRKQTPIKEAYDRESFFYSKIVPIFKETQLLKSVEQPFTNFPKCYSVHNEDKKEAIILENLKKIGFDLHDRKNAMDMQHIQLVFMQYAKFHSLSLALKKNKPSMFNSITKNMTDVLGDFIIQGKMVHIFQANFENVKKLLEADNKIDILKKYEGFENQIEQVLVNFSNSTTDFSVILHGDCWNNNFMFKYDENDPKKPIEMKFLDFQLSRVASPILDLSYFLYCCGDKNIFKEIDSLLQTYHDSMTKFLNQLGCSAETACSLKMLKEQWKTYGKFGIVMALFILKISLCDLEEAPDFAADAESGEGFKDIQNINNQELYESRIKDVYVHFAEKFM